MKKLLLFSICVIVGLSVWAQKRPTYEDRQKMRRGRGIESRTQGGQGYTQGQGIGGSSGGGGAAVEVTALIDFELSANSIFDTNEFYKATRTNNLYAPVWSMNPDPQNQNVTTNDLGWPLILPVKVGNTTYSGASTHSAFCGFKTNTPAFNSGIYTFPTTIRQGQMNFTAFVFFTTPTWVGSGDTSDIIEIDGAGEYITANIAWDNPPTLRAHSNTNFGSVVTVANIITNAWYCISMSWDTNVGPTGFSYVELRNGTNGAFIGRAGLGHQTKQMAELIRIGRDDHSYTSEHPMRFDNGILRTNLTGNTTTNFVWPSLQ